MPLGPPASLVFASRLVGPATASGVQVAGLFTSPVPFQARQRTFSGPSVDQAATSVFPSRASVPL